MLFANISLSAQSYALHNQQIKANIFLFFCYSWMYTLDLVLNEFKPIIGQVSINNDRILLNEKDDLFDIVRTYFNDEKNIIIQPS